MSARQDKPADVALVIDFLNTMDVEEGTDVLNAFPSWHSWAGERELIPDGLADAVDARTALRAAVGDPALTSTATRIPVDIELTAHKPVLVPRTAVGAVLAAATRLGVLGRWARIKICPADECRWAFYDESRNHSRTWCSMQVCGNRAKARVWRERHGG